VGFGTPSSTALGWANFATDYLGPHTTPDAALTSALIDAQNGIGGAVIGGTIYFPPSGVSYTFQQTHTITGSCALVSTDRNDTVLAFDFGSVVDGGTSASSFIITGPNVTLQGFTILYPNQSIASGGGNVAAVRVIDTSGVTIEDFRVTSGFAGIDCIGSSVYCYDVEVLDMLDPVDSGDIGFGFRAQPLSAGGDPPGLRMLVSECNPDTLNSPTGVQAAYMLVPPYPEMIIDTGGGGASNYGVLVTTGATSGVSVVRVRHVNPEDCSDGLYAAGGTIVQSSMFIADANGRTVTLSPTFSGMATLVGAHYVAFGPSGNGLTVGVSPSAGLAEVPSPAIRNVPHARAAE